VTHHPLSKQQASRSENVDKPNNAEDILFVEFWLE